MREGPNYYAVLPAEVRYDRRLKANEKLLYAELSALCKAQGYCWATNEYFANLYHVSKETVSRWLSNLQVCGYVKICLNKDYENGRRILLYSPDLPHDENIKGVDEKVMPPMTKTSSHPLTKKSTIIIQELNNTSLITTPFIPPGEEVEEMKAVPYEEIQQQYNAICVSLRRCSVLSDKRKKTIHARFKSGYTLEHFVEVFRRAQASGFLKGANNKDWQADFDWLICDSNMAKVLDGRYSNREKGGQDGQPKLGGITRL